MPERPVRIVRHIDARLDRRSVEPLSRQVVDALWEAVVDGTLEPGERLPTIRQLAIELRLHPDTATRAYADLELLGVIVTRRGEGTFVGLKPSERVELERRAQLADICRRAVHDAAALGISIDDLLATLAEYRQTEPTAPPKRKSG